MFKYSTMHNVQEWLFDPNLGKIVAAICALLFARLLSGLVARGLSRHVTDSTSQYRVRKLVSFFGYFAAAVAVTVIFSDKLGGLTVAFGVAGAGIAFALQEVIASMAGWVAVMFGGYYRIGDRIQLGGIKGDVVDIGIVRTTLMEIGEWVKGDLYSGRIVRVANSFVFKEPVHNYSADFPFLWDEITIPIKFGGEYGEARSIIEGVAHEELADFSHEAKLTWAKMVGKFAIEDARVEPLVTMAVNDNWVEFTLRYVVDFKRRRATKDALWTKILARVEATTGRVGFASMTVHLVETPDLKVHLKKD